MDSLPAVTSFPQSASSVCVCVSEGGIRVRVLLGSMTQRNRMLVRVVRASSLHAQGAVRSHTYYRRVYVMVVVVGGGSHLG